MKRIFIIDLSLTLALLLAATVAVMAQGRGFGRGFGMGPGYDPPGKLVPQTKLNGSCREDPSIVFTEDQTQKLENLGRAFLEEAKPLWSELRDLRLELRYAVSDPQAQPEVLLDKQRKMSAIQDKLENLRFSYLVKARAIFTKEQLERFPADCPLKMGTGYGAGRRFGRGLPKGFRP
jgi:Spy/CpxP family protein refolding chaperone